MNLGLILRTAAHLTEVCDKFSPLLIISLIGRVGIIIMVLEVSVKHKCVCGRKEVVFLCLNTVSKIIYLYRNL